MCPINNEFSQMRPLGCVHLRPERRAEQQGTYIKNVEIHPSLTA